jgi:purine-binding chemotaxis protein CheW
MRPFIQFTSRNILKSNEYFLAFSVDSDWFAVNFPKIAGFSKEFQFERYSGNVRFIGGIAHVNGEYIPVIDVKNKIGMSCEPFRNTGKLVVIETEIFCNNLKFGIMYDSLGDAFETSSKKALSTPEFSNYIESGNLEGVQILDNHCVMLLSIDNLFTIDDLIDIKIAFPSSVQKA